MLLNPIAAFEFLGNGGPSLSFSLPCILWIRKIFLFHHSSSCKLIQHVWDSLLLLFERTSMRWFLEGKNLDIGMKTNIFIPLLSGKKDIITFCTKYSVLFWRKYWTFILKHYCPVYSLIVLCKYDPAYEENLCWIVWVPDIFLDQLHCLAHGNMMKFTCHSSYN